MLTVNHAAQLHRLPHFDENVAACHHLLWSLRRQLLCRSQAAALSSSLSKTPGFTLGFAFDSLAAVRRYPKYLKGRTTDDCGTLLKSYRTCVMVRHSRVHTPFPRQPSFAAPMGTHGYED